MGVLRKHELDISRAIMDDLWTIIGVEYYKSIEPHVIANQSEHFIKKYCSVHGLINLVCRIKDIEHSLIDSSHNSHYPYANKHAAEFNEIIQKIVNRLELNGELL